MEVLDASYLNQDLNSNRHFFRPLADQLEDGCSKAHRTPFNVGDSDVGKSIGLQGATKRTETNIPCFEAEEVRLAFRLSFVSVVPELLNSALLQNQNPSQCAGPRRAARKRNFRRGQVAPENPQRQVRRVGRDQPSQSGTKRLRRQVPEAILERGRLDSENAAEPLCRQEGRIPPQGTNF